MTPTITRRSVLAGGALTLAAPRAFAAGPLGEIRVDYASHNPLSLVIRSRGLLEKAFAPGRLGRGGTLAAHVQATLVRVLCGFAMGAAAGIALGGLTGTFRAARLLLDPTVQALRAIPSLAWVPLFILWLGIFEPSKVALIAVGVFFPIYLGTMAATRRVDGQLVDLGRIYGASPARLVRLITLPALLPEVVTALRSGLGLGFMFVVAAEIMGASEGLGYLLVDGQQLGKADQILAAIVAFALLGKALDGLVVAVSRPFTRWSEMR